MRCKKVEQNLPDYLSGELSPKKYAMLVKHLAGCPACETIQTKLKQTDVQMRTMFAKTIKGIQVPNNLQNNIKDKIAMQQVNPGLLKRKLRFFSPRVVAGILVIFLVLGAGWYGLGKYDGFWFKQYFGNNQQLAGNYRQGKTPSPLGTDNDRKQKNLQPKAPSNKANRERLSLPANIRDTVKAPTLNLKENGEEKVKQQKKDVLSGQKSMETTQLKESKYGNMAASTGDKQGTRAGEEKAVGFGAWQPAYLPAGSTVEDKVYWNKEINLLTRNYRVKASRPEEYLAFQIGQSRDNPANFQ
jgi:hypothetical protein